MHHGGQETHPTAREIESLRNWCVMHVCMLCNDFVTCAFNPERDSLSTPFDIRNAIPMRRTGISACLFRCDTSV